MEILLYPHKLQSGWSYVLHKLNQFVYNFIISLTFIPGYFCCQMSEVTSDHVYL